MSQSETYMLIILGFALATLVAMVVGRLAWKLALRMGARRALRNVPSTVVELQTDRDRLRAEHAMMAAKLQTVSQDVRMHLAEQEAEVMRSRNRVLQLMDEAVKRDAEIASLKEQLLHLEQEKSASGELIGLLKSSLDAKPNKTAHAPSPAPTPKIIDGVSEDVSSQERLQHRISELATISAQMARQREENAAEAPSLSNGVLVKPANSTSFEPELPPRIEVAPERAAAELQSELERLDAAWNEPVADPANQQEAEKPRRGITNVISLAQRIRALQKTITN